jgi:hypothetical protein
MSAHRILAYLPLCHNPFSRPLYFKRGKRHVLLGKEMQFDTLATLISNTSRMIRDFCRFLPPTKHSVIIMAGVLLPTTLRSSCLS